jgi:hydrogenase maturation protease
VTYRTIIGVGNDLRHDDGFGPAVVAHLRTHPPLATGVTLAVTDGEPTRLIDLWTDAEVAVVIDAVRAPGDPVGHRYELVFDEVMRLGTAAVSSHGVSLGETFELARVLDRLPQRLVVLGAAGLHFGPGAGLSPELAAIVAQVAQRATELVGESWLLQS